MPYEVYDKIGASVIVTDEQLEAAFMRPGHDLEVELIRGMEESRDRRFAPRLREALSHELQKARISATYGLLTFLDRESIPALRALRDSLPERPVSSPIEERGIVDAVLIRLEGGAHAALLTFDDESYSPLIKCLLISNLFGSRLSFEREDVELLVKALDDFVFKRSAWVRALSASDRNEGIEDAVEALARVAEETDLLAKLGAQQQQMLHDAGKDLLTRRTDELVKECVVEFARGLPEELALSMLKPLLTKGARGDIKKALKATLLTFEQKRQS